MSHSIPEDIRSLLGVYTHAKTPTAVSVRLIEYRDEADMPPSVGLAAHGDLESFRLRPFTKYNFQDLQDLPIAIQNLEKLGFTLTLPESSPDFATRSIDILAPALRLTQILYCSARHGISFSDAEKLVLSRQ